jgi:hypothetical protein
MERVEQASGTRPSEQEAADLDSHSSRRAPRGPWRHLRTRLLSQLDLPHRRAFLAMLIIASPLLVLYPYGVSATGDSAVVVNTAKLVAEIDNTWLLKSQEPPFLQVVYGPWLGMIDDTKPLVLIPIVSTLLLAALTSALAARLTRSTLVGLFGGLVLLAAFVPVRQGRHLAMYAAFVGFGLLGIWMAKGFVREESASYRRAVGAAVLTLLAVTSHGGGLYFLGLVPATILFVKDRRSLTRYLGMLGIVSIVFLPWLVSRLWIGGFDRIHSPRTTWFVAQGHQSRIARDFWDQVVQSPGDIATFLPQQFLAMLGWTAWIVIPLGLIGMLKLSTRGRLFVVVAVLGLVTPMVVYQVRIFPRYFYPLLPLTALLAAVGLSGAMSYVRSTRLRLVAPLMAAVLIAAVAFGFFARLTNTVSAAREEFESAERADLVRIASLIDDDRAVIGWRRSTVLMLEAPDIFVYYADVLTEDEFVSYLTWQREKIRQMLDRRNIGWALLLKPARWEASRNATWLEPAYGVRPKHVRKIREDPMSCLAYNGARYRLYKLRSSAQARTGESC